MISGTFFFGGIRNALLFFRREAITVAALFLFQGVVESLLEVDAGLVGDTSEDPEHVGDLFGEVLSGVGQVARFGDLVAIDSSDDAGEFAGFFGE